MTAEAGSSTVQRFFIGGGIQEPECDRLGPWRKSVCEMWMPETNWLLPWITKVPT
jgi:hypothetical protein